MVSVMTARLTGAITNNAAAGLMLSTVSVAEWREASILPFAVVSMFATLSGFMAPFGYQTNPMLYGPGRSI